MSKINITIDLTKERAIDMIVGEEIDAYEHYNTTRTIYADSSISDILYEIEMELEAIQKELQDKNKIIEKEKLRLSKLPFHEILEIGEQKQLWKLTERQKRLV